MKSTNASLAVVTNHFKNPTIVKGKEAVGRMGKFAIDRDTIIRLSKNPKVLICPDMDFVLFMGVSDGRLIDYVMARN